jgi:uncharacterized DUF497 family protein
MEFEWNPDKAVANLRKHNISFQEATTVFDDSLSVTFPDPDHSIGESRYVIIGMSGAGQYWLSPTLIEKTALVLSALEEPLARKGGFMKKEVDELEDELRPEYDFAKMAGGVRGKYVERYRAGTNLVLLDPDIAQAFPTDASVNEALRLLLQIAQRQQPNNPVGAD